MNKFYKILSLTLLFSTQIFAQSGTIRGYIKDAKTNEELIGATVAVEGTSLGAITDLSGFFTINKVPAGTYNVVITYISYQTKKLEKVRVETSQVTEINALLIEDNATLEEVKVIAKRITGSEVSVISEIKAAQMVVNGISSQQIGRSLDRDAAQVAKRIPGVTITGDRFLIIRGLNQRYNNVMLHNVFTPSMETDVKSFSFDVIPSSQIDRLLIFKSPDAELPGEFAGGVVKIFTKNIPNENSLEFSYSLTAREGTTFRDFYQGDMGPNYWTGFNNKYQSLPSSFPSSINEVANNPDRLSEVGRQLRNNWVSSPIKAMPDQRFSLTGNYVIDRGDLKIGNITTVNYSNSRTNFMVNRADFDATDGDVLSPIFQFEDAQYSQNIRVGILHNWSVRFNENHSIDFKNLFNQMSNSRYVDRGGRHIEQNRGVNDHSFDQVYRGIYTGQLMGKHDFNEKKTTLEWVYGFNTSFRDQPDYRRYRSDVNNGETTLYIPTGAAQAFFLGRFNSFMNETAHMANVSVNQKFKFIQNREAEAKVGFFWEDKKRTFDARNIGYVRSSSFNFNQALVLGTIDQLFQTSNINSTTGIKIDEQTNPSDSYRAQNKQFAYYGKVNLPITQKLNLITGVRVEDNTQAMQSAFIGGGPVSISFPILSVLPSVNATYNFSEKSLVRAAYGETINRPEFRETAPFAFFDFDYNFVYKGNPNLKPANIHNFDVRYEFYPSPTQLISFAYFYKKFSNSIETFVEPGAGSGGAKTFTYRNGERAYSTGVELEVKKDLDGVFNSTFTNKLSLLFNAAFIYSRVDLGAQAVGQSDDRPLQGQSPYIINAGLTYNDPKKDFQVNVLYNVVGRRIFAIGFEFYPDLYEMPRNVLDITFAKSIGKKFQLKGGVQDLLNNQNLLMQDANGDGKFQTSRDQINASFLPGRQYSLGLSYRLF